MTTSVAICVFDDVEVLDFAGPYEVFTTASRVFRRSDAESPEPFSVFTVARARATIRARAGLRVQPDCAIDDHPAIDLLVIPGGIVTAELAIPEVIEWIARVAASAGLAASVCTGSFLLARAGLLDGKSATTHWEDIQDLRTMFPSVHAVEERRWVDEGSVVTSAGISAGIDMSLHLVERIAGRELALKTARQMDFDWNEMPDARATFPASNASRYLWAGPCSIVGILALLALLPFGARPRLVEGTLEVAVFPPPARRRTRESWLPFRAITLGHVVIGRDCDDLDRLRAHEQTHVRQYEKWGLFLFLAYPASSLVQLLRGRNPYHHNHFEVQARAAARASEGSQA